MKGIIETNKIEATDHAEIEAEIMEKYGDLLHGSNVTGDQMEAIAQHIMMTDTDFDLAWLDDAQADDVEAAVETAPVATELKPGSAIYRDCDNNYEIHCVSITKNGKFKIAELGAGRPYYCRITERGRIAFEKQNWEYFRMARAAVTEGASWTK